MREPEHTCPLIDGVISQVRDIETDLTNIKGYADMDDVINALDDVLIDYFQTKKLWGSTRYGICDLFEKIRDANSELRTWGTHHKEETERLEREVEDLQDEIMRLKDELDDANGEIHSLENEVTNLDSELRRVERELEDSNKIGEDN
jgi:predicted  nucleic acid-binding Zn-ribbon protein